MISGRVRRERKTTFGQWGSQGGTLFAPEKLREKIQGKKRDDGKRALQLAVSVARRCVKHAKCPKGVGLGGGAR
jgi:hypothetical protein